MLGMDENYAIIGAANGGDRVPCDSDWPKHKLGLREGYAIIGAAKSGDRLPCDSD